MRHLSINEITEQWNFLFSVISILTIHETKLDYSFPSGQFILDGYSEPVRLDRNRNGGGAIIYVREDTLANCSVNIISQKM